MKTKILSLAILSLWSITNVFAQDRTTVTANNSDISDNLDLRAVASIFGDSRDLDDFERRLNDPNAQISNLDLNGDNRVDYLRVIETVEGNVHLIIIQSVLGRDNYQDIATVEVERDRYNRVQVQVVGDVYMYGNNYIYEPVYAYTPVIYTSFWVNHYRPYYSSWYWGYYPSFYVAWTPFPIYTYHSHIGIYINLNHHYNYVDYRRCSVVYNNYYNGRRGNAYERQYPTRSFAQRNTGYVNRRELDNTRQTGTRNSIAASGTRNNSNGVNSTRNTSPRTVTNQENTRNANSPRNTTSPRSESGNIESPRSVKNPRSVTTQETTRNSDSPRTVTTQSSPRENGQTSPRSYGNTRSAESPRSVETQTSPRNDNSQAAPRSYGNTRSSESSGSVATQTSPRNNNSQAAPRSYENTRNTEMQRSANQGNSNNRMSESPRSSNQREFSQQRGNSPRSEGASRGNGNRRG